MKTILVPTDFSKNAQNALKYALAYAEKTKSKILLYHSYINPTSELILPFSNLHVGQSEAKQNAEEQMIKLSASVLKTSPKARFRWAVEPGLTVDNIIRFAKENKADLLIMGTTGQGAIASSIMGSTTASIISEAPCSVLAIPPNAKFESIDTVIIATDPENKNVKAIVKSAEFAKLHKANLSLVYIQDLEYFDSDKALKNMVSSVKTQSGYRNISYAIQHGTDVVSGLDAYVKKEKPNVLAMMTHERKFPEMLWNPSRTKAISYHTTIPLLVLHPGFAKKAAVKKKK
ncbi:MAG: universal stress protein [Bacteroidetes bacterium]|nr:universal stress protein [Bacteroidota bacterium]